MNRVFKVLWSHTLGKWVVTSELGRSRKKAKRTQLATTVATAVMVGAMGVGGAGTLTIDDKTYEFPYSTESDTWIEIEDGDVLDAVNVVGENTSLVLHQKGGVGGVTLNVESLTLTNTLTELGNLNVEHTFKYSGDAFLIEESASLNNVKDGTLEIKNYHNDGVLESIIEIEEELNLNSSSLKITQSDDVSEYILIDKINIDEDSELHLNVKQVIEGSELDNGGILSGIASLEHDVKNSGKIYVGNALAHVNSGTTRSNDGKFGILTVDSYEGFKGSELHFGTELNGDDSKHDKLIILDGATGESVVVVHPVGDVLKDSTEEGIHLVQVDRNSSDLKLDLDEIVDGYTFVDAWDLKEKEDGWFLQYAGAEKQEVVDPTDPVVRTEANAYLANLVMANEMFTMRYHDRLYAPKENGLWTQGKASFSKFKSNLTGDVSSKTDYFTIRIGKDLVSTDEYVMGIMAAYGHSTGKTENNRHDVRKTDHSSDAFAVGIYGSYTFAPHSYVDAWAQYVHARNKVEWGTKHFDYTEKYNSKGALLSLEAAYGVNIADSVYFQPQGQITYMGVKADTHKDARGREFGSNRGNVQLRLGARFFGENVFANGQGTPYVEANYIHNTKANKVKMQAASGGITDIELDGAKNLFQLKVGSDFNLNNNSKIGAHVSHTFGKKSYRDTQLNVDFRYNF